jgi:hypothetical protein
MVGYSHQGAQKWQQSINMLLLAALELSIAKTVYLINEGARAWT